MCEKVLLDLWKVGKKTSGLVKGFEMLAVTQVRKKCLNPEILNDNDNKKKK